MQPADLRAAAIWSAASVLWTLLAGTAAVAAGFASGSPLLVAFGSVGTLDGVGSAMLARHFRRAFRHREVSARGEHVGLLVIAGGLGLIAAGTAFESIRRLVSSTTGEFSALGVSVAASSIFAFSVLAIGKRRVGARVASRALVADSHVSMMGASFALLTVGGAVATALLGWWWLDPSLSVAVAGIGFGLAVAHVRADAAAVSPPVLPPLPRPQPPPRDPGTASRQG